MDSRKIKRNRIKCLKCGEVLESTHRHDFVMCECGNFVDGGREYVRYGGKLEAIELLTEYEE